MPCYAPLTAWYSKEVGRSGKRGITFERKSAFSGIKLSLPCGQCVGCRLEKSRQWAIRCMHEKSMHDRNVFLTLTYDDANLPAGGTLVKRDLQLFMKRLRKMFGSGVRFYACGEYGERSGRPHYHLLLFNCEFTDKVFYKRAKRGEKLYTSEIVRSLWPFGFNVVGDVSFDSAAYVARYLLQKRHGDAAIKHYAGRATEFCVMSRRPGIGTLWFSKFHGEAYAWDSVIMNGKRIRPPRFYDTKYDLVDSVRLAKLKVTRRRKALLRLDDNGPDRRRVRELVQLKRLAMASREV